MLRDEAVRNPSGRGAPDEFEEDDELDLDDDDDEDDENDADEGKDEDDEWESIQT